MLHRDPCLSGLLPVTTFLRCTMLGCRHACSTRISRQDVTGMPAMTPQIGKTKQHAAGQPCLAAVQMVHSPSRSLSMRTFFRATISPVVRSRALSADVNQHRQRVCPLHLMI